MLQLLPGTRPCLATPVLLILAVQSVPIKISDDPQKMCCARMMPVLYSVFPILGLVTKTIQVFPDSVPSPPELQIR